LAQNAVAQSGDGSSAISSNFNDTAIPAGDWIWFTSVEGAWSGLSIGDDWVYGFD
jgi:hypothetical protein